MRWILRLCLAVFSLTVAGGPAALPVRAAEHSPLRHPAGIALSTGVRITPEEDMQKTYGPVTLFSMRLLLPSHTGTQRFAGIEFSETDGNPFYHLPASDMGEPAHLTVRSMEVGIRTTGVRAVSKPEVFVGLAVRYTGVEETVTGVDVDHPELSSRATGQGLGLRILGGPEWEFSRGRWAAGLEASLEMFDVRAGEPPRPRTISLWGALVRASLVLRL